MVVPLETILLSRPFKFVVGTHEIPITVYEAAIAVQSPTLASLVQKEISESLFAEIKWEDIDKGTFLRLVEFIYSGDYSTPQSPPVQSNQRLSQALPTEPLSKKNKKRSRVRSFPAIPPLESFNSLNYPVPKTRSIFANTREHDIGNGKSENSVFLIHASLYLYRALAALYLDASSVQDLVELVRYAYLDEQTLELEHGTDQLRGLICHYIAANSGVTAEHAAFTDLLKEEGALASDVWKIAAPRIRVAE
ncbi:hypothetical protein BDZ45DRAFT_807699 [Acephala macrosclerotiorum]|nr:hypothetical protein BDZ45DRAFT_807699 [Acephala macrosclerotiorum]